MSRTVETRDYVRMVGRMIRAAGRRVGADDVEQLQELLELRAELDQAIGLAVRDLRQSGWTWRAIGEATGTSHAAAIQKWGRRYA